MQSKSGKPALLLIILMLTALTITSCGNSITGTWTNSILGIETMLQFNSDGTFSVSTLGILAASGTYTVSGNQLTLTFSTAVYDIGVSAGTSTFSVSGDQLIVDNLVYTRE